MRRGERREGDRRALLSVITQHSTTHGEGKGDLAMGVLEPARELGVVGHGEGELDVVEMERMQDCEMDDLVAEE